MESKHIRFSVVDDTTNIFMNHHYLKSWAFGAKTNNIKELDIAIKEAEFANTAAELACSKGISREEFEYQLIGMLRILKSEHWKVIK